MTYCRTVLAVLLVVGSLGGCVSSDNVERVRELGVKKQGLRFADNCAGYLQFGYAEQIEASQEQAYRAIRYAMEVYYSEPWSAEADWAFGRGHDWETVREVFAAVVEILDIEDHRGDQQITYDCGVCSRPDFVAETTFLSPFAVRLCEPFWRVPMENWYYVLQHEYFHWPLIHDDVAYGDAAIELAENNPGEAVMNADNYALYVDLLQNP